MRLSRALLALALTAWTVLSAPPSACRAGDEAPTIGLEEVVRLALERNPDIASSLQETQAAEARYRQAFASYLPRLSSQTSYARKWFEDPAATGVPPSAGTDFNYYYNALTVNQYLFDFGLTSGRVDKGRHSADASRQQLGTSVADVVQSVKKAYFGVLKARELVGVNEESLRVQQDHLEQARAFFQSGLRPKIDVTKGEVELAKTRLALIKARYDLRTSRVDMENVLGGPPVRGAYHLAEITLKPMAPSGLRPLLDEAFQKRPELADIKAQEAAARAQITSAQGNYWPQLALGSSYYWQETDFPLDKSWVGGPTLSWEFFSGFKTDAEVNEARANLLKIKAQRRSRELKVTKDVNDAHLKVNQALESIDTAREGLRQAQENMELAEGRYRTGVGNAIEYSDAELTLTQAKSDLVQAIYDYWQNLADLDRAIGRGAELAAQVK